MKHIINAIQKLDKTTIALGVYFLLLPTDCFRIGEIGSLIKVYAFVPVIFLLLSGGCRYLIFDKLLSRLLLFLMVAAFSIFWTINFDITVSSFKSLLLNIILVVLMAGTYRYSEVEIKFLLNCLIASSWITVICMLLFGDRSIGGRLTLAIGDSVQDPNYVAGYILFAFSYHITNFLEKKKLHQLLLAMTIFVVIILTGSRGALAAYLACAFFAVIYSIQESRHPGRVIVLATASAFAAYFAFSVAMQAVDTSVSSRFSLEYLLEHGATGRGDIWAHLLHKFRTASLGRQLLGHGYGTTRLMNTLRGSRGGLVAHNLYIDDLISVGIIGALVQLSIQVQCIRMAFQAKSRMLICLYGAFIVMTFSLSLTNYKPIWSTMMVIIISRAALIRGNQ